LASDGLILNFFLEGNRGSRNFTGGRPPYCPHGTAPDFGSGWARSLHLWSGSVGSR